MIKGEGNLSMCCFFFFFCYGRLLYPFNIACYLPSFKRGVPPAEAPFIVEDMPQMHRFVFDFYSQYVQSLRAQQQVRWTVLFCSCLVLKCYGQNRALWLDFEWSDFRCTYRQGEQLTNWIHSFVRVSEKNVQKWAVSVEEDCFFVSPVIICVERRREKQNVGTSL